MTQHHHNFPPSTATHHLHLHLLYVVITVLATSFPRTKSARVYTVTAQLLHTLYYYYYYTADATLTPTTPMVTLLVHLYTALCITAAAVLHSNKQQQCTTNTRKHRPPPPAAHDQQYTFITYRGKNNKNKNNASTSAAAAAAAAAIKDELEQFSSSSSSGGGVGGGDDHHHAITSLEYAVCWDEEHPLRCSAATSTTATTTSATPSLFHQPSNTVSYMCGNSLGLQPITTRGLITEELDKWASRAVCGHFEGERPWFSIEDTVQCSMGRLVGANNPRLEVTVMNSLTTNLQLLLCAFYRPNVNGGRYRIVMEMNPFPSDMHAIVSHILWRDMGLDPEDTIIMVAPPDADGCSSNNICTDDIVDLLKSDDLGPTIALVLLSGVQFMTGQVFDMGAITRAAHTYQPGCMVGWDLAHAVGNVELKLHEWGVDFACWCTYKYLNSGPGNIGGIFVHEKYAHMGMEDLPRLVGWWAHKRDTRFQLTNRFTPESGAKGFQLSNPPVLGVVSLLASLQVFDSAGGMAPLRQRSLRLTTYLEILLRRLLMEAHDQPTVMVQQSIDLDGTDTGTTDTTGRLPLVRPLVTILTPCDNLEHRGCQISIRLPVPVKLVADMLLERGVVCDEREPDIVRIAPAPLYNTMVDVWNCVNTLKQVLLVHLWDKNDTLVHQGHTYTLMRHNNNNKNNAIATTTTTTTTVLPAAIKKRQ